MEDGKERCPSEEDDGLGTRRESDGFDTPIRLSAPPPTSEGFNFEGVQEARGQEDGEGRETPNQQPREEPVATTREAGDLGRSAPTKVSRPPWNDADVDSPCRSSQTRRRDQGRVEESGLSAQAQGRGGLPREGKEEVIGSPVLAGPCADAGKPEDLLPPVMAGTEGLVSPGVLTSDNAPRDAGESAGTAGHQNSCLEFVTLLKIQFSDDFHKLCKEAMLSWPCVTQLGVTTLQLLLHGPVDGHWMKTLPEALKKSFSTSPFRGKGIFPLPLPPVGAAVRMLRLMERSPSGIADDAQRHVEFKSNPTPSTA